MTPHLTETQLFDLLDQQPTHHEHLASCSCCRDEFEMLQSAVGDFRSALTRLSAASPALMRMPVPQTKSRFRLITGNPWALSLASAVVLAGLALPLVHHTARVAENPAAKVQKHSQQDDDALLESIDRDLAAPVAAPLEPLTIDASSGNQLHSKN